MAQTLGRRKFLKSLSLGTGAVLLAACGASTPPAAEQTAPTAAPAGNDTPPTSAPAADPTDAPAAEAPATDAPATDAPAASAESGLPIVTEPLTLSYWVETNSNILVTAPTFNEISLYKELEKRTGIHINFQHPPTGPNQGREQFNLMVASGQYPDVIETNWLTGYYQGGPAKALRDGVIIPLNDKLDEFAPNLSRLLKENPEWRKQIVTDEGDIYCFPFIRGDPSLQVFGGAVIREDWLKKVGLDMPTTMDEWHDALVAFKEKDPNGNGNADEWPFSPWSGSFRGGFDGISAFIGAWGITTRFTQVDGKVIYGPIQPEFKEFVAMLRSWYEEGLIDPDSVSMDQAGFDARMTGEQLGSGMMLLGGGIGKFMGLMAEKNPEFSLVGAPYPTLNKGDKKLIGQRENLFPGVGAAITSSNQNVETTMRWLDYAYSEAGHMLFNFGTEGLSYTMVDDYPTFTDLVMFNPDKLPVAQAMAAHVRSNSSGPFIQDKRYAEQYFQLQQQKDAYVIWQEPTNERLMPPVTPTQEESRRFNTIMNDINTRYEEVFAKVVTGAEPLEAWDTFQQTELPQLGINEAIEIQQAALDRYNKR
jgi:putative aldouronate transport system substrate-binding protein